MIFAQISPSWEAAGVEPATRVENTQLTDSEIASNAENATISKFAVQSLYKHCLKFAKFHDCQVCVQIAYKEFQELPESQQLHLPIHSTDDLKYFSLIYTSVLWRFRIFNLNHSGNSPNEPVETADLSPSCTHCHLMILFYAAKQSARQETNSVDAASADCTLNLFCKNCLSGVKGRMIGAAQYDGETVPGRILG